MLRLPPKRVFELDRSRPQRIVVTVAGSIQEVDPDDTSGNKHQLFAITVEQVVDNPSHAALKKGDIVNVSVAFGERRALPERIPDLAAGKPIRLRGAFIPKSSAYPEPDGDWEPVIHFTHHPLGWVEYQGKRYE